ncbi:MAG: carboxypeptidase-like regulatory domain-containing protein, partial [Halioglobus sp.]
MKKFSIYSGVFLACISHQVLAANLYLLAFLDDAPLKGITVSLDDQEVGDTDGSGGVQAILEPGSHVVILTGRDFVYPIEFSATRDEDVEISVTFQDLLAADPVVRIEKFGPDSVAGLGYLTGQIANAAGMALEGVRVVFTGTQYSALTDENGIYSLRVERGLYDLKVSSSDYDEINVSGVRVMANLGVTASFTLSDMDKLEISSGNVIEEVFVMGVFNPVEDSSSIERYATSITSAIDVAQLERFGDSDVAAALNRVAGVAVTDSKYA